VHPTLLNSLWLANPEPAETYEPPETRPSLMFIIIIAFQVLLISSAMLVVYGEPAIANRITLYAFVLLAVGVASHATSVIGGFRKTQRGLAHMSVLSQGGRTADRFLEIHPRGGFWSADEADRRMFWEIP